MDLRSIIDGCVDTEGGSSITASAPSTYIITDHEPNHAVVMAKGDMPLAPIAMSQTKDDLLKHLNLQLATYALMAVS